LDFSISAVIWFVSLFGVSVMNGIFISTHDNQVRQHSELGGRSRPWWWAGC
jgi:cobalt-zinc-cadmium resistance protein CzcA